MSEVTPINWVYFPKSSPPPEFGLRVVALFEDVADTIDSSARTGQHSDTVMALLRPGLEKLAYSERWRSAFRGDGDHDSVLMPITIPS